MRTLAFRISFNAQTFVVKHPAKIPYGTRTARNVEEVHLLPPSPRSHKTPPRSFTWGTKMRLLPEKHVTKQL